MFKRIWEKIVQHKKKVIIVAISTLVVIGLILGTVFGALALRRMDPLPQWVTDTFTGIQAALVVIMALACIVIIIAILASPPQTGVGANAITGAAESYYTKNKGKNNQGRIRMIIIICALTIALCAILYFVAFGVYPGA